MTVHLPYITYLFWRIFLILHNTGCSHWHTSYVVCTSQTKDIEWQQTNDIIKTSPYPILDMHKGQQFNKNEYEMLWLYKAGEEKDTASMLRICILWILPSSLKWKTKLWMDGTSYYIIIKSIQMPICLQIKYCVFISNICHLWI